MDNLTKAQRRKNMQNIKSKGTTPERKLARALRSLGFYFAQNVKTLPGKPDFVFRKKKVAIFVDSDFWHGHPKRFAEPKSNRQYWLPKIARNKNRDKEVTRLLKSRGWKVLRLWEFDVKRNTKQAVNRVLKFLQKSQKRLN